MAEISSEEGLDRTGLSNPVKHRTWHKLAIVLMLSLPVALALTSSLVSPLFESPDELEHYLFVRSLIDEGKLPIQDPDGDLSQFHQPPLYYVIGSLLTAGIQDQQSIPPRNPHWTSYPIEKVHRDNKTQFLPSREMVFPFSGTAAVAHILRLWSVALVAGTVIVIWRLGKELFPNEISHQLLFLALATLIPMYLYIGGSINNDNLVTFLGVLLLWLAIRAIGNGFDWPTTLLIGLFWGLALLSKLSAVMLIVPWGIALLWVSWQRKDWSLLVTRTITIGAGALLLSAWWFIRNFLLYGDPTGLELMLDIWGERTSYELFKANFISTSALKYSWTSFLGRFGYGQIILPSIIYWIYGVIVLLGLGGLLLKIRRLARRKSWPDRPGVWLVIIVTLFVFVLGLLYYSYRSPTGANGRYTYPALPAFAALITAGLTAFKPSRKMVTALLVVLVSLAFFCLAVFVPWTYASPRKLTTEAAMHEIETPSDLTWSESIRLLGTRLEPSILTDGPGSEMKLTACWRAEAPMEHNYTFFVHLLDKDLNPLGQRNMHPGLGNFPTSLWKPGDIFCDEYKVPVVENILDAPLAAVVEIGFFDTYPAQRLQAQTASGQPIDLVTIGQIKITPETPAEPPPADHVLDSVNFEQGVRLTGYEWSSDTAMPGDEITLLLWWQSEGALDKDYMIFAHLLDEDDQIITQADGPPQSGRYPTNFWGLGDTIIDRRTFTLPETIMTGPSIVRLGFYDLESGVRLPRTNGSTLPDSFEIEGPFIGQ